MTTQTRRFVRHASLFAGVALVMATSAMAAQPVLNTDRTAAPVVTQGRAAPISTLGQSIAGHATKLGGYLDIAHRYPVRDTQDIAHRYP